MRTFCNEVCAIDCSVASKINHVDSARRRSEIIRMSFTSQHSPGVPGLSQAGTLVAHKNCATSISDCGKMSSLVLATSFAWQRQSISLIFLPDSHSLERKLDSARPLKERTHRVSKLPLHLRRLPFGNRFTALARARAEELSRPRPASGATSRRPRCLDDRRQKLADS